MASDKASSRDQSLGPVCDADTQEWGDRNQAIHEAMVELVSHAGAAGAHYGARAYLRVPATNAEAGQSVAERIIKLRKAIDASRPDRLGVDLVTVVWARRLARVMRRDPDRDVNFSLLESKRQLRAVLDFAAATSLDPAGSGSTEPPTSADDVERLAGTPGALIAAYATANVNWVADPRAHIAALHRAHEDLEGAFADRDAEMERLKAERDDLLRHRAASEAPGWTYQGPHSAGAHLSDAAVADRVRMLLREDPEHEAVCVMARDRIRDLSREVARMRTAVDEVERSAVPFARLSAFEIDVLAERRRQVEKEGWSAEHDDSHETGELASAAACYAHHASMPDDLRAGYERKGPTRDWPLDRAFWKPTDRRRDAVKGAALLLAFGDSIDRTEGGR